jgi:hypothetical protein
VGAPGGAAVAFGPAMNNSSIEVSPHRAYWLSGLLVYPLGAFIFTAMLLGILSPVFQFKMTPPLILGLWAAMTLCIAFVACMRDYKNLFYVLTPTSLILGRGPTPAEIHFGEIQSIVLGLPEDPARWIRFLAAFQKVESVFRDEGLISRSRKQCVLVRLSRQRYAPLLLNVRFLNNGDALTQEFLKLNARKVVGHETYTDLEKSRFGGYVRFNSIIEVNSAG